MATQQQQQQQQHESAHLYSFTPDTPTGQFLQRLSHLFTTLRPHNPTLYRGTPLAGFASLLLVTFANALLSPMRDAAALAIGVRHIPNLTLASTVLALCSSVPVGWLFEAPDPKLKRRRFLRRMGLTRGETQGTSLALFYRCFGLVLVVYSGGFKMRELLLQGTAGDAVDPVQLPADTTPAAGLSMDTTTHLQQNSSSWFSTLLTLLLHKNLAILLAKFIFRLIQTLWSQIPFLHLLPSLREVGYIAFFLVVHLMKLHSISLMWGVVGEAMEYEEQAALWCFLQRKKRRDKLRKNKKNKRRRLLLEKHKQEKQVEDRSLVVLKQGEEGGGGASEATEGNLSRNNTSDTALVSLSDSGAGEMAGSSNEKNVPTKPLPQSQMLSSSKNKSQQEQKTLDDDDDDDEEEEEEKNEEEGDEEIATQEGRSKARLTRLAFVGLGGTIGGIAGSFVASITAHTLHLSGLLLLAAILLAFSANLSVELGNMMQRHWEDQQRRLFEEQQHQQQKQQQQQQKQQLHQQQQQQQKKQQQHQQQQMLQQEKNVVGSGASMAANQAWEKRDDDEAGMTPPLPTFVAGSEDTTTTASSSSSQSPTQPQPQAQAPLVHLPPSLSNPMASLANEKDSDEEEDDDEDDDGEEAALDISMMRRSSSCGSMKRVASGNSLAQNREQNHSVNSLTSLASLGNGTHNANSTTGLTRTQSGPSLTTASMEDKSTSQFTNEMNGTNTGAAVPLHNNSTNSTTAWPSHSRTAPQSQLQQPPTPPPPTPDETEDSFSQRLLRGVTMILRSKLLMAIFTYNALYASTTVLLSFLRAELVANRADGGDDHNNKGSTEADTAFLARINVLSNVAVFALQASGLGAFVAHSCGQRGTLALMPIVRLCGVLLLAWWHMITNGQPPNLILFLILDEFTKVINFAVAKPVREGLWRGLSNEARYEAKPIVDTLANRWGSGSAAFLVSLMDRLLALVLGRGGHSNGSSKEEALELSATGGNSMTSLVSSRTIFGFPPVLLLCLVISLWWAMVSAHLGHIRRRIDVELKKHQ